MRATLALALALLSLGAAADEPPAPRPDRAEALTPAALRAAPPSPRPKGAARAITPDAAPAIDRVSLQNRSEGALCGDRRLRGQRAATISGPGGCGVADPVRLDAVGAVRLEPPVTVDCAVGRALADWVDEVVQPAAQVEEGVPVTVLRTYAGYVCRPRNNQRNAKLSLHGKGLAIDIAAFRFADGRAISVLEDWRRADGSAFLRRVWRGACGPFGTVLGPDADRFHVGHLHFDVAEYTHGRVCR